MGVDPASSANLGYAFINFLTPSDAESFLSHFSGFGNWGIVCNKNCSPEWSTTEQGLKANIARYRNRRVMHPSVPDDQKPVMFQNGLQIPFPSPTKKLQAPGALA